MSDLESILDNGFRDLNVRINEDLREFALDEGEFLARVVTTESTVLLRAPDAGVIERYLTTKELDVPVGPGSLRLGEALTQFEKGQSRAIKQVINDGLLLGDTIDDMAKRIQGLATSRSQAQVRALTRTLTNFGASQARRAFNVENKNVFDGEEWVATLDGRTTLLCGGRDGNVYGVGRGPYPPAHWNCRSVRVPVLNKEFQAKSQKTNREDFDSWLREQPAEFQDEYFSQFSNGLDKALLFRQGDLEIQRFRDETGREYSLEQLRGLYPQVFRDTGIDI